MNERLKSTLRQFIRFGIVGVSNTLIGYALNIGTLLLLRPYGLSWDYYAANLVAFVLGVLWSFYWNNRFVFKQGDNEERVWWKTLLKTYASYALSGLVLTNILAWFWVEQLGISKYLAPIPTLLFTVPMNFLLNKFWAFKN